MKKKDINVTWGMYKSRVKTLVKLVRDLKISHIVAIADGGLIPAVHVSKLTGVPFSVIRYKSYDGRIQKHIHHEGEMVSKVAINGGNILIIDDIKDTGKTMARALQHILTYGPSLCNAAFLYEKNPGDGWIVFPWER